MSMLGLVGAKQGDAIMYRIYIVPSQVQQGEVIKLMQVVPSN